MATWQGSVGGALLELQNLIGFLSTMAKYYRFTYKSAVLCFTAVSTVPGLDHCTYDVPDPGSSYYSPPKCIYTPAHHPHSFLHGYGLPNCNKYLLVDSNSGSCVAAGYHHCCSGGNGSCRTGSCYCDEACFENGDCCRDINELNCTCNRSMNVVTYIGSEFLLKTKQSKISNVVITILLMFVVVILFFFLVQHFQLSLLG